MQAAIDRVFRSISFRLAAGIANNTPSVASRDDAEALAERLLENFKGQLLRNASQRH